MSFLAANLPLLSLVIVVVIVFSVTMFFTFNRAEKASIKISAEEFGSNVVNNQGNLTVLYSTVLSATSGMSYLGGGSKKLKVSTDGNYNIISTTRVVENVSTFPIDATFTVTIRHNENNATVTDLILPGTIDQAKSTSVNALIPLKEAFEYSIVLRYVNNASSGDITIDLAKTTLEITA